MDTKKSPTVVISKKDIVDENTLKNLLKSSSALHENNDETIGRFNSRNLTTSTPISSKSSTKSRTSLKNAGAKSSGGQSSKRRKNRNNYDDEDDNTGMQTLDEMEASLNLSQSLTLEDCEDIKMDTNLASLIEQEMFNPSESFGNEFDQSTCVKKPPKKSRKNPTPKRKKNNGKAVQDDDDVESLESNTIRNIKTPICLPKKRKLDELDKSFDECDSSTTTTATRRTSRTAAVRARQRVKCMEQDNDPVNASFGGEDDDEYVEEMSKVEKEDDDEDDDEFEGSLDDDDDDDDDESIVIKKEVSKISMVKEGGKRKKWTDVYDKDIVLKLRQRQQQLNLLPDWMPRKDFYKEITPEEGKKYLPVSQKVKFRIQCRSSVPPPERSIELNLFEHHTSEDAFTIKIGGPLWSMDWCPTPMSKPFNQYLALYTHQSPAQTFTTTIPSSFKNKCLIQIWDFGRLTHRMSATVPDLLPLLVVDGGPIWQMKWAPGASTWISGADDDIFKSRIGLLACACHCGSVKIYSIPRFPRKKDTKSSIPQPQEEHTQQHTFFEVTPTLTLKTTGSAYVPCICVDWNVSEKCLIVAAGFADGAVALWNLNTCTTMLSGIKTEDGDPSRSFMYPYRTFKAHLSVVSGLHFCPTTDTLLLTCSHDKYMKVWNINETNRCLLSHRTYKITASSWPANERSRFYAGFDEAYILQRNSVACYNFYESKVVHIGHCLHNGTINSISHKEWSSIVTGCDNTGCVQSCLSIPEKIKGIFSHRKLITMVQVEDDDDNESSEDVATAPCKCKSFSEHQMDDLGSFPISCCCNKRFIIKDFNKHWQFKSTIKSQTELPFDDMVKSPYSALHRVSWNPNKESCDWIAFGGLNGLLRIRFVPDSQTQKK